MKASVIVGAGLPWELHEVPTPEPGPGQVLVRVHASALCHNDVLVSMGVIPMAAFTPAVTGHEAAGEVVAVGAGVTARAVGDRVGVPWIQGACGRCDYCARGLPLTGQTGFHCTAPAMTGITVPGGQAEYVVAAADGTVLLPDDLDYEVAAPVLCSGYTAWSALRRGAPVAGDRVAVLGVGGIGHLAVQFAASLGFETVAITRSPDKRALARELGADLVVSTGAELAEVGGADVILATGPSSDAASEALRGLRTGGRIVLSGIDGIGSFSIPPDMARPFFAQGQQVLGATHDGPDRLREALDIVASGRVRPWTEVHPAERVAQAVERVAKGEVRFKAVVTY